MGKIGDLFVRLGLKKDTFSAGIKDAQKELGGFQKAMSALGGAAKIGWGAVAAAVVKFAKDSIALTQKWGDQWSVAMAGVKGAYEAFVRQISSGEGWDNLFANMREAARVARETAASLDEIFEKNNSAAFEIAKIENEIARLQITARDRSVSEEERQKALQDILAKEQQIGDIRVKYAKEEADTRKNALMSQTKMTEEQIKTVIENYNRNKDIIDEARAYLAQEAEYQKKIDRNKWNFVGSGETANAAAKAAAGLQELNATTSQAIKNVAEALRNYDKANDDLIKGYIDAEIAAINFDTAAKRAQVNPTRQLSTLSGAGTDSGMSRASAILKRAEDSAKSEVQLLYEKYQEEMALLQKYGLDSEALTAEYWRSMREIIDRGLSDSMKPIEDYEPIEIEPVEIDWSEIDADINEQLNILTEQLHRAEDVINMFADAISGGFADAMQELMDQIAGLSESNPGAVFKALLTPLADMAIKSGEIIMAEGVALEAAKKGLFAFSGLAPIAAGATLIAVGAAAKSGLQALAQSGGKNTSISSYNAGAGAGGQVGEFQSELTVYVKGTIRGSDIVLSGQKTVNNWGR